MRTLRLLPIVILTITTFAFAATASGNGLPSGGRVLGQSTIEPAYDDGTGDIIYLLTPNHAPDPVRSNPKAWSPLYLVVYPTSAAASAGTLNCMDVPVENCPDHGPAVAGAAAEIMPGVYGGGVVGHDHLLDAPGGAEFDVAWEPVLVLFTNSAAANEHTTKDAQIDAAADRGDVIEIPLPDLTFTCPVVSAVTYSRAVPVD